MDTEKRIKEIVKEKRSKSEIYPFTSIAQAIEAQEGCRIMMTARKGGLGARTYSRLTQDCIEYFIIFPALSGNEKRDLNIRFHVAHELAHIALNHDEILHPQEEFRYYEDADREIFEADCFAAKLLLEIEEVEFKKRSIPSSQDINKILVSVGRKYAPNELNKILDC